MTRAIAAADLNGDGPNDVVAGPAVVTSGDTNGDGLPELLVADGHAQLLTLVNSSY